jgi:hypothetical protein
MTEMDVVPLEVDLQQGEQRVEQEALKGNQDEEDEVDLWILSRLVDRPNLLFQ